MSIMHVFTIADDNAVWRSGVSQFRTHISIPWDEAAELCMDPAHLAAMVKLARTADRGAKLHGRIFDAMRGVYLAKPATEYHRRDTGPMAVVTGSGVFTRIELEEYLDSFTSEDWAAAKELGVRLLRLSGGLDL